MAWLDVAGGTLYLHLSLFERLGGFVHGDAQIPLTAVRHARVTENPWAELRGARMPGTSFSRRTAVGTWKFPGGKDFVAVRGRGPGVVVELTGLEFARIVVSTRDADAVVDEINEAAAAARS